LLVKRQGILIKQQTAFSSFQFGLKSRSGRF
jgi:hypothetical protein